MKNARQSGSGGRFFLLLENAAEALESLSSSDFGFLFDLFTSFLINHFHGQANLAAIIKAEQLNVRRCRLP